MNIFEAIVLGIVQGATEFLPISSTAHLRIVPALCGWADPGAAFTAVVQWGTLIAVLIYFRNDLIRLVRGVIQGLREGKPLSNPDARLGWWIALGTIPIVVCGFAFKDQVKGPLRDLRVISGALIGLAVLMMFAEWIVQRRKRQSNESGKDLEALTLFDVLLVGIAQAFALIPGTSRSGVTITAALFLGMNRYTAARFSFLLSLPAIFGAGVYELIQEKDTLLATQSDFVALMVSMIVAGIVGYGSIAFLLRYLQRHSTWLFIVYRCLLGIALLLLVWEGILLPIASK